MADYSKMDDARLKEQIKKLKQIVSRSGSEEAKAKFNAEIKSMEKELANRSGSKPEAEKPKPQQRPKPKPEAEKPQQKPKPKPEAEKPKPQGKRGVQMLSTRKVMVDGVEMNMNSQEFCDYLLAEFKERRIKAEERKGSKTKTKSVMAKVSDNIEKGITQAIKESVKTQKSKIEKNPREFFSKVKKLEIATKTFLNSLKNVLGNQFDGKEVNSTIKGIQDLVNELKKKVEK